MCSGADIWRKNCAAFFAVPGIFAGHSRGRMRDRQEATGAQAAAVLSDDAPRVRLTGTKCSEEAQISATG